VSELSYVVEFLPTAEQAWLRFAEEEQEELTSWVRKLAQNPLPGGRSGVIRLRGVTFQGRPVFYSHTEHFGLYHFVSEQRVWIFIIVERPLLDVTPA
jgi:hypothetical protein